MTDVTAQNGKAAVSGMSSLVNRAVLQALIWGAVAAALCVPMLTMITAEDFNRLKLIPNWGTLPVAVILFAAVAFLGTLAGSGEGTGEIWATVQRYARRAFVALAAWFLVGLVARRLRGGVGVRRARVSFRQHRRPRHVVDVLLRRAALCAPDGAGRGTRIRTLNRGHTS